MGNCASPQKRTEGSLNWPSSAKIVHLDGRLQEFRQPIKAGHVISQNPKCFLCCSESMYIDSRVPHVPDDEELQLGQIYFLMPQSKSQAPLSLQELCSLAIKANSALTYLDMGHYPSKKPVQQPSYKKTSPRITTAAPGSYKAPARFDVVGMNSPAPRPAKPIQENTIVLNS